MLNDQRLALVRESNLRRRMDRVHMHFLIHPRVTDFLGRRAFPVPGTAVLCALQAAPERRPA